jgi:hypothetical protein
MTHRDDTPEHVHPTSKRELRRAIDSIRGMLEVWSNEATETGWTRFRKVQ